MATMIINQKIMASRTNLQGPTKSISNSFRFLSDSQSSKAFERNMDPPIRSTPKLSGIVLRILSSKNSQKGCLWIAGIEKSEVKIDTFFQKKKKIATLELTRATNLEANVQERA